MNLVSIESPLRSRKIVSFCLYGDNPIYVDGALENLDRMPRIFPDWRALFFVSPTLPKKVMDSLRTHVSEVRVVPEQYVTEREQLIKGMYWRLYALDSIDAAYLLFRDCDSRISFKEAAAVSSWLKSGKDYHFMYDHPFHTTPILGGMWGCRGGVVSNIRDRIEKYRAGLAPDASYRDQSDQAFLLSEIWPSVRATDAYLAHGEVENCEYHLGIGMRIESFPRYEIPADWTLPEPRFVGQTVAVPGGLPKTEKA